MTFQEQLLVAWRFVGLAASPRPDGSGVTFCCPRCPAPARLNITEQLVCCPECQWTATGEPEAIAKAAKDAAPTKFDADTTAILARCKFDLSRPPLVPVPLYSLAGHVIATAENIMVVQAKMKAGKSAVIGAMLAATMEPEGDCLHFTSANPKQHAVLHFDTEQSRYDHHNLIVRSLRRAGRCSPPAWLYSYHLKGHSIPEIKRLVLAAIEAAAQDCGGVHSFGLDGIGDLCADVNDAGEASALVAEMERLAILYQALALCALHENPGTDIGKTRGHLGSHLARKAETNLRLEKDGDGITVMFADASRSVHIPKHKGLRFQWSDEQKAHVSMESGIDVKRGNLTILAAECFRNDGGIGLTWEQLHEAIDEKERCSRSTSQRRFNAMLTQKIIHHSNAKYRLS